MNLYTRCAHCDTVFRVTTRDLQASSGRVRCGHCHIVFDAFATLSAQEPSPGSAPPQQAIMEAAVNEAAVAQKADKEIADGVGPAPVETQSRKQGSPPLRASATLKRDDPAASLYEWEFKVPPPPRRTALWATLSLLLLLGAGLQTAYAFRTAMLVNYPQTRPLFDQACEWIGCSNQLPRLVEWLHIEASDLQAIEPGRANEVELTALIRNRAPVAVEYPAFELTLTNATEQVIARRVFLPAEYLDPNVRQAEGLRGRGEMAIRLSLDTGSVRASGYRVYLFYPS